VPFGQDPGNVDPRVGKHLFAQQRKIEGLEKSLQEMQALLRAVSTTPKWIEDLAGRRVPYFATIDIVIAANSTSKVEGTHTVSTDGPFAVVGLALFYQRTTAPYAGLWSPATTFGAKIAPASQQLGFGYLFDSPLMGSFDVELATSGAARNWQNSPFASALFGEATGGVYVMPVADLLGRSDVVTVRVTPTVAQPIAGKVQAILLGYKIIQGDVYAP